MKYMYHVFLSSMFFTPAYRYAAQYIAEAPAGSNKALDLTWQRRHATRQTSASGLKRYVDDVAGISSGLGEGRGGRFITATNPKGSIYSRHVPKDDPHFTMHTRKTDRFRSMFEYREETLKTAGDKRISYNSSTFPWLESVHTFQNLASIGGDTDVVRVGIEDVRKRGSGHFIAHWRWQGYRECVDIDYFDDRQIANIDGKQGAGVMWNKIEHCQFEESRVVTPCRVVAKTADLCIKDLATAGIPLASDSARIGINVVPWKMPAAVKMWSDAVTAPLSKPTCVNENSLTTLLGTDSFAPPGDTNGWTGWRASPRVKEVAGKTCKSTMWSGRPMTLRGAVLACTESPCKGFAWKLKDAAKDKWPSADPETLYDVVFCKSTELVDSTYWGGVVLKDGTALVTPPTTDSLLATLPFKAPSDAAAAEAVYKDAIMVSFQPKNVKDEDINASIPTGFKLGTNFFVDNGEVFGARGGGTGGGGQEYGWTCSMTARVQNQYRRAPSRPVSISTTNALVSTYCSGGATLGNDYRRNVRWSFKVRQETHSEYRRKVVRFLIVPCLVCGHTCSCFVLMTVYSSLSPLAFTQVPNGMYDVHTHQGAGMASRHIQTWNNGCSVNNVRMGYGPSTSKDAIAISIDPSGKVKSNIFGPQVCEPLPPKQ